MLGHVNVKYRKLLFIVDPVVLSYGSLRIVYLSLV